MWEKGPQMVNDDDHVRELLDLIRDKRLLAPDAFARERFDTIVSIYNGIGPEAWPQRYREWVTSILCRYEPEALIHDWEFVFQPKTYFSFTLANLRWACNSVIKAWHTHRCGGKLFWVDAGCGVACALFCQLGGWQAYKTGKLPDNQKHQEDL